MPGQDVLLTTHIEAQRAQLMSVGKNKRVIDSDGNESLAL